MAEKMTALDWETVIAYSENDMERWKTADALHLSKSGVDYHLKKTKRVTGYDPKSFYGLVKILNMRDGNQSDEFIDRASVLAEYGNLMEAQKRREELSGISEQLPPERLLTIVKHIPAVDAERVVHGSWILVHRAAFVGCFACSKCGRIISVDNRYVNGGRGLEDYPYCHCGAKMDWRDTDGR